MSHAVARSFKSVVETATSSWPIGSSSGRSSRRSAMKFSAIAVRPRQAHRQVNLFSLIFCGFDLFGLRSVVNYD